MGSKWWTATSDIHSPFALLNCSTMSTVEIWDRHCKVWRDNSEARRPDIKEGHVLIIQRFPVGRVCTSAQELSATCGGSSPYSMFALLKILLHLLWGALGWEKVRASDMISDLGLQDRHTRKKCIPHSPSLSKILLLSKFNNYFSV